MSKAVFFSLLLIAYAFSASARVGDGCTYYPDQMAWLVEPSDGSEPTRTCSPDQTKWPHTVENPQGFRAGTSMRIVVDKNADVQRLVYQIFDAGGNLVETDSWLVTTGRELGFEVCTDEIDRAPTRKSTTLVENVPVRLEDLYQKWASTSYGTSGPDGHILPGREAPMPFAINYEYFHSETGKAVAAGEFLHAVPNPATQNKFLGHRQSGGCVRSQDENQHRLYDRAVEILNLENSSLAAVTVTIIDSSLQGQRLPGGTYDKPGVRPAERILFKNACLKTEAQKQRFCSGASSYLEQTLAAHQDTEFYKESKAKLDSQCNQLESEELDPDTPFDSDTGNAEVFYKKFQDKKYQDKKKIQKDSKKYFWDAVDNCPLPRLLTCNLQNTKCTCRPPDPVRTQKARAKGKPREKTNFNYEVFVTPVKKKRAAVKKSKERTFFTPQFTTPNKPWPRVKKSQERSLFNPQNKNTKPWPSTKKARQKPYSNSVRDSFDERGRKSPRRSMDLPSGSSIIDCALFMGVGCLF